MVAPSRVPGPMPQRRVVLSPDGRLPVTERYIVASDAHTFDGTPIAQLTQTGLEVGGLTLWRLDGPARLATVERGIRHPRNVEQIIIAPDNSLRAHRPEANARQQKHQRVMNENPRRA